MTETIDSERLPALLRPGMRIYVSGSSNEPQRLIQALAQRPQCAAGVTFVQFPLPGINVTDFSALHPEARMEAFFLTPELRPGFERRRVQLVPMQMRRVFDYLQRCARFDLSLVQLGDSRDGEFLPGPCVDFHEAAMANTQAVVAEVNSRVPRLAHAPAIAAERVDYILPSARALDEYPSPRIDANARAIGAHVASLVADGSCIQTGIGAIPAAVLDALGEKNDLGVHSGLIDDGVMRLAARGVINGRRKAIDTGVVVTGMAIGSAELYAWLDGREEVRFTGADYTHEISVIARLERFVSINSAVEVDLYGQVNAEMVGARQLSGTGGALDFMRGARASSGGKSIIALTATARRGAISRIVSQLPAGTAITAPRTDVDYVVTEHGIAHLHGLSVDARAQALIDIAAPEFRTQLREAWRERER